MDEQIGRLGKRVAAQDERIAQLERRVERSSRNSSQPPGSDPPSTSPKRGKDRCGRKQGAQTGHEGKGRPLLATWAVDEIVEHWPSECGCGHVFAVSDRVSVGQPTRHQVEELPIMAVTVTEHQCRRERCPACAATVTAQLPSEVAGSAFGPRLQAAIVTLSIRNRVSRRDVVELCEQLFSSRISIGTIDAILTRAGDAFAEPYGDLLARVRSADALNMDEPGGA
jgi:transposase